MAASSVASTTSISSVASSTASTVVPNGRVSDNLLEGLFRLGSVGCAARTESGAAPPGTVSRLLAEQEALEHDSLDLVERLPEVTRILGWTPSMTLPVLDASELAPKDEAVIYKQRGQIFRWREGEWKERGAGDVMLLKHKGTDRTRFLMWQEKTFKTIANFNLVETSSHYCLLHPDDDPKTWTWCCEDHSDDCTYDEKFALHFKTEECAVAFKNAFDGAKVRDGGAIVASAALQQGTLVACAAPLQQGSSSTTEPPAIETILEGGDQCEAGTSPSSGGGSPKRGCSADTAVAADNDGEVLAEGVHALQL